MRHRTFALIAVLSTLLAALLAGAQPTKVPYLGYMSPGDIPRYDNAFLRGLQEQGYIFGAFDMLRHFGHHIGEVTPRVEGDWIEL